MSQNNDTLKPEIVEFNMLSLKEKYEKIMDYVKSHDNMYFVIIEENNLKSTDNSYGIVEKAFEDNSDDKYSTMRFIVRIAGENVNFKETAVDYKEIVRVFEMFITDNNEFVLIHYNTYGIESKYYGNIIAINKDSNNGCIFSKYTSNFVDWLVGNKNP